MRPYSTAYPDLVANGGELIARAELLVDGVAQRSTEDGSLGLKLTGGSITADRTITGGGDTPQARPRQANLQLVETDTASDDLATELAPTTGRELRITVGLSDTDLFTQGVFGVSSRRRRYERGGWTWQLTGYDRSRRVARDRFTDAFQITAGAACSTLIDIVRSRIPFDIDVVLEASSGCELEETAFTVDADPWAAVQKLATAAGFFARFDADGTFRTGPIVDDFDTPVWTYANETVTIERLELADDDTEAYNGVIVIGDGSFLLFPVRGEAWIEDPADPLYRYGSYGERPLIVRNGFVATEDQANAAAAAQLNLLPGSGEIVTWNAAPNPAHELGDVFAVTLPDAGIDDRWVLDAYSLDLATGAMSGTTRKRRSA